MNAAVPGLDHSGDCGRTGPDTYIWYVDNDTFQEDPGAASPEEYDHISIRGATQVTQTAVRDGTPGVTELDDVIELIGNGAVTVQTSGGTITLDNIESIGVAAGGGADTVILHNLGHTDVRELSVDLSSPDETGRTDGDTVVVAGSNTSRDIDIIEVRGAREDAGKDVIRITHTTGEKLCDAVILNGDPAREYLYVAGRDDSAIAVFSRDADSGGLLVRGICPERLLRRSRLAGSGLVGRDRRVCLRGGRRHDPRLGHRRSLHDDDRGRRRRRHDPRGRRCLGGPGHCRRR